MVCIVPSLIAHADENSTAQAKDAANQPIAGELQFLQGTWEGVMVGHEKDGNITITIAGNSLHFHRDTKFWFKTTFALPTGPDPKQLHATIKDSAPGQGNIVGEVVIALYKIEDGKLTLAVLGGDDEETPKSFKAAEEKGLARYELRKVQPPKEPTEPSKAK